MGNWHNLFDIKIRIVALSRVQEMLYYFYGASLFFVVFNTLSNKLQPADIHFFPSFGAFGFFCPVVLPENIKAGKNSNQSPVNIYSQLYAFRIIMK
jgi:hypothetical protein